MQTIFNERMDTKKLRQKILDLAIHGKLIPQDPNDEPASVLLERIRAEKERLIKEGKIKQSKKSAKSSDTPHYENEVPFEVPEGWEWTTLGELCSFLSRGKSPKYSEERKYPVFAQKCNLYDGDISLEKARFLDPETISKWSDEYKLIDGDILVNSTGTGTVGRTRLFHSDVLGDYPFVVPDSHVSVVRSFEEIESKFVLAFLSSDYGQTYIEDNLAGSTNQKELYIGVLDNMQFPLPPHEEQFRIVTTVDKWFTLIDTLESAKEDLQASITQAKSKILDLAIHGKLVPQDPSEEPAIELLKRINPKFVPCDNAHYENNTIEIPKNWEWVKLSDIAVSELGKTLDKGKNSGTPRNYLCAFNVKWCSFDLSVIKKILLEDEELERYRVRKGDLLICEGGDVGRAAIWESDQDIYYQNALHRVRFKDEISQYFYLYVLQYYKSLGMIDDVSGGVTIKHFTQNSMKKLSFPLPPIKEQYRIVSAINQYNTILDDISANL